MEKTIASITKPKDEELKERLSADQGQRSEASGTGFVRGIWGCRKGQCVKQDH